ncbi:FecR domain-containing protein [Pedobacter sp. KR3-3]|uniref:FecR domain-containing protein n=1 Tax=Pedobacter albus TaxID=3113905 RepID=A0ABU7I4K6_9SPHI|nr:FecR domain-containing protein [Pedobacter sp. KR3-3]MEE1944199.1 FecR domain-containing protein [Pedobacter sp. KR3-3]
MNKHKEAHVLLNNYRQGKCSAEELALLENWYLVHEDEELQLSAEELLEAKLEVWQKLPFYRHNKPMAKLWPRLVVAAMLVLCTSVALWLAKQRNTKVVQSAKTAVIQPGSNKATLTLANGTQITLDGSVAGKLTEDHGIAISKDKSGALVYTLLPISQQVTLAQKTNAIATPRGGQYQVNLPDGTKVWLNAETTLTYPLVFDASERKVDLKGEAYFEVAHDATRPFKVITANQTVRVLGTHFNVEAYENEAITKTTLLSGKVQVEETKDHTAVLLKPGQQAVSENEEINVADVPANDAVAWKNGYFMFNNEPLGSMMKKIARWYNVEVLCPPQLASMTFSGSGPRSYNINQILNKIELTNAIHFKIEGRRVVVMP